MSNRAPRGYRFNPFYFLFILYFVSNAIALVMVACGMPIAVEMREFQFDETIIAASALALFSSLFAALAAYRLGLAIETPRHIMTFGRMAALTLMLVQLSYFLYSTYYGVNIAGVEDDIVENSNLKLVFSVIQPDQLFLIFAVGIRSNRLFWINAIIYVISLTLRGWMGGLYLLALVVAIRNAPLVVTRKGFVITGLLLSVGIIILPMIVSAKWFIRSGAGVSEAMDFLSEFGYLNYLIDSVSYVVNRFQHLGHVAMLAQDSQKLSTAYELGEFTPYWMDGAPQWLFLRLNGIDIFQFQRFIASHYFDANNLAYAVNPGIAGWFFVLQVKVVFFVFFLLAVTLPPTLLILRFAGHRYFLLASCMVLVYLFHGWIGAYVNFVLYLIAFMLAQRLLFGRSSVRQVGAEVRLSS